MCLVVAGDYLSARISILLRLLKKIALFLVQLSVMSHYFFFSSNDYRIYKKHSTIWSLYRVWSTEISTFRYWWGKCAAQRNIRSRNQKEDLCLRQTLLPISIFFLEMTGKNKKETAYRLRRLVLPEQNSPIRTNLIIVLCNFLLRAVSSYGSGGSLSMIKDKYVCVQ